MRKTQIPKETKSSATQMSVNIPYILYKYTYRYIPADSLWPFWDAENVTLSKVNRDLQLVDKKVANWIT